MHLDMEIWHDFRNEAATLGRELDKIRRRHKGRLPMQHEKVEKLLIEIGCVLEGCSQWMDKSGSFMPRTLWKYDHKDETTHMSSEKFAYSHLLHLI